MTLEEIDDRIALMKAAGRTTMPVPLSEWREFMATKIGKASVGKTKSGKTTVKTIDRAPVSAKIGRKKKADRIEKGLRANREAAKSKGKAA